MQSQTLRSEVPGELGGRVALRLMLSLAATRPSNRESRVVDVPLTSTTREALGLGLDELFKAGVEVGPERVECAVARQAVEIT